MISHLLDSDRMLLEILRDRGPVTVPELCRLLGVTATAVRQRLDRVVAAGLVHREEIRQGRGRPGYAYRLTDQGLRAMGNGQSDLAAVLWRQLLSIPDAELRNRLLADVSRELALAAGTGDSAASGQKVAVGKAAAATPGGVTSRLEDVAAGLRARNMAVAVETGAEGELPVLRFTACPYPDLSALGHEVCAMETSMLSRLAGFPLRLAECRCHSSDGACTFVPAPSQDPEQVCQAEGMGPG